MYRQTKRQAVKIITLFQWPGRTKGSAPDPNDEVSQLRAQLQVMVAVVVGMNVVVVAMAVVVVMVSVVVAEIVVVASGNGGWQGRCSGDGDR